MKKILYLTTLISLLVTSQVAFAKEPPICPNANLIKTTGLNYVFFNCHDASYIVSQDSNYGTQSLWNFSMMPIEAPFGPYGEKQALQKGLMALQSLYGNPQPKYNPAYGWKCDYSLQDPSIQAFAYVGN